MTTTVNRSDITLSEEEIRVSFTQVIPNWTARVFGQAPTGEWIEMSRQAANRQAAYDALSAALAEQGITIKEDA